MAASRGNENFLKNWRGMGSFQTNIRTITAPYYRKDSDNNNYIKEGNINKGTIVTYEDSETLEHTRAAIRIGNDIFYTNIDNLVKPKSLNVVNLTAQSFGLGGTTKTVFDYKDSLIEGINSRSDIKGDLKEYLLELIDYADTGQQSISGYDIEPYMVNFIIKQFGETIGPIYCIRRGLSKFNLNVNNGTRIYIPSSLSEPLLDYILISGDRQIKVSAKGRGSTNTLKMVSLVPPILNNPRLLGKYNNDIHFNVMRFIHENSMILGPIRACYLLGFINLQQLQILNTNSQYAIPRLPDGNLDPVKFNILSPLILKDARIMGQVALRIGITTKEISFLCEKLVINFSKQSQNSIKFTKVVKDVLESELYFAKFNISNNTASFNIQATTGSAGINNLFFRTKNGYMSKSDKLGFAL